MNIEEQIAYPDQARVLVKDFYNAFVADRDNPRAKTVSLNEVYVVWFSKTIQNWKALCGTTNSGDGAYFEVTHNGDAQETYIDHYQKTGHFTVRDDGTSPNVVGLPGVEL